MAVKGGAKLVACQMSMDLMGLRREELIDGIEVGGVATYLEASERADNNLLYMTQKGASAPAWQWFKSMSRAVAPTTK